MKLISRAGRYYFHSERFMKNIGHFRTPQDGLGTFNKVEKLEDLITKVGTIDIFARFNIIIVASNGDVSAPVQ